MIYSYRIEQAIRAAAVLHKDQTRKGRIPLPYVTHLYAVALMVSDYTDNEDTVIAALLHDTIEDTEYTPAEIQKDFGEAVAKIVMEVTETVRSEGHKENWNVRKERYTKQLGKANDEALIVAAADKIHNMRSIIEEYFDRHGRFLADFGGSLRDRLLFYQEISNILNRRLKNDIIHEFNHVFSEYKNFIAHAEKHTKAESGHV